jgi:hypothetical protein
VVVVFLAGLVGVINFSARAATAPNAEPISETILCFFAMNFAYFILSEAK